MDAYIIKGYRTAVGKAPKGNLRSARPDDMAASLIQHLVKEVGIEPSLIDDVIVGNATPEAEQGLNVGRLISLMGLNNIEVPGMTVNRYCSSGIETIAIADSKIKNGMNQCILAGGVESMSAINMGGWRIVPNARVAKEHPTYYWGMGLTAEAVAKKYNISREDQDAFAFQSHQKAIKAIESNQFKAEIFPLEIEHTWVNGYNKIKHKIHLNEW